MATDGETERKINNNFYLTYGQNVMSAQMLEVSLLEAVLRLGRDACSTVK